MFERIGYRKGKRFPPTLAVTALAAKWGADVVRVHDIPENVAGARTVATMNDTGSGSRLI